MKLKRLPEDFQVDELTDFAADDAGEFALYRLIKRRLGTPEVIEAVLRRWNIARGQFSYGGLKDRHAVTSQFVTIRRGPRRDLRQTNFELEYHGQAARPFGPSDIRANRFQIVLRSLAAEEAAAARAVAAEVRRDGLPNYFDDQRFGSVGESGEFVARAWIAGDYERALWLALAEPNPLDRPRDRDEKRLLREHWGDWPTCKAKLERSYRRSTVAFLGDRPGDFRRALARVRADLRSLYLSAFQSHLWNRILAALLEQTCPPEQLMVVELKVGRSPFFRALDNTARSVLRAAQVPLPSSRIRLDAGPVQHLVDRSLAELGLELRDIRIKYPRDSFFSKGWRAATFEVANLAHEIADDDLYRGRQKLTLRFDLPRGSYATILVKRITVAAGGSADSIEGDVEDSADEETDAAIENEA
jgi:tRNA pseudouridine13 synthase